MAVQKICEAGKEPKYPFAGLRIGDHFVPLQHIFIPLFHPRCLRRIPAAESQSDFAYLSLQCGDVGLSDFWLDSE